MTLTWADIDARWPDAGVLWDRDVAPTLDWEPRFSDVHGHLWADDPECKQRGYGRCRCLLWERGSWSTVAHYPNGWTQHPMCTPLRNYSSDSSRWPDHEWQRQVMGEWVAPQRPFRDRVFDSVRVILNRRDLRDYQPLFDAISDPRGDLYPDERRVHREALRVAGRIMRYEGRRVPWGEQIDTDLTFASWDY